MAATGMVDGLVFASLTWPDLESLSWTDSFTEQHFKAFIARQGTSRDKLVPSTYSTTVSAAGGAGGDAPHAETMTSVWAPEPFEPVAFFRISQLSQGAIAKLPRPCRAKYVTIKFLSPSAMSQVALAGVSVVGLPGAHPLGSILGTAKFAETVATVVQEVLLSC